MPNEAGSLSVAEYKALRATIRERGSLRFLVTLITFSAWAAGLITVCAVFAFPLFAVVPLVVLMAGFEISFAIHVGVERIGRYLQVRFEKPPAGDPGWETTIMAVRLPASGIDPLFLRMFLIAAAANWILTLWLTAGETELPIVSGFRTEVLALGALHLLAALRWLGCARFARSQRTADLEAFERTLRP